MQSLRCHERIASSVPWAERPTDGPEPARTLPNVGVPHRRWSSSAERVPPIDRPKRLRVSQHLDRDKRVGPGVGHYRDASAYHDWNWVA